MTPFPGTFLWLLAHDMRINWRRFTDLFGNASPRLIAFAGAGATVVLFLAAWPTVRWLSPQIHGNGSPAASMVVIAICTFTWMIAQSLFGATRALFDRGDLDLLLGSPLSATRVFAAKAAAIAASTFGSIAVLTVPIAIVGALIDRHAWLGFIPALIALALIATSLALAIAIGLFFMTGPRRARVYANMAGAVIGGAFILFAQIVAMLPQAAREDLTGWLEQAGQAHATGVAVLVWLPIQAARGDSAAMAILLAAGIICFAVTVAVLANLFADASLAAAGAELSGGSKLGAQAEPSFRAGIGRNLRRKEWRLLVRDPAMFAQLGLQIIYTIPVAVVLLRSDTLPAAFALAPTIVVVAAQVAASLAWITVSGEDAPELIASAPVSSVAADRAKLSAVALPVLAIVALPLMALAIASWRSALVAAAFATAAATSTALLNFWHPMPGNRRGMLRRHSQSKLVALVEHTLAVCWAVAIVFALLGNAMAVLPVTVVVGVLAFIRARQAPTTMASAGRPMVHPAPALPSRI